MKLQIPAGTMFAPNWGNLGSTESIVIKPPGPITINPDLLDGVVLRFSEFQRNNPAPEWHNPWWYGNEFLGLSGLYGPYGPAQIAAEAKSVESIRLSGQLRHAAGRAIGLASTINDASNDLCTRLDALRSSFQTHWESLRESYVALHEQEHALVARATGITNIMGPVAPAASVRYRLAVLAATPFQIQPEPSGYRISPSLTSPFAAFIDGQHAYYAIPEWLVQYEETLRNIRSTVAACVWLAWSAHFTAQALRIVNGVKAIIIALLKRLGIDHAVVRTARRWYLLHGEHPPRAFDRAIESLIVSGACFSPSIA